MIDELAFPRTAKYDKRWIRENALGENALCQAESLAGHLPFSAGMRVLELGCGKATGSIFLAREFRRRGGLVVSNGEEERRQREGQLVVCLLPQDASEPAQGHSQSSQVVGADGGTLASCGWSCGHGAFPSPR